MELDFENAYVAVSGRQIAPKYKTSKKSRGKRTFT